MTVRTYCRRPIYDRKPRTRYEIDGLLQIVLSTSIAALPQRVHLSRVEESARALVVLDVDR